MVNFKVLFAWSIVKWLVYLQISHSKYWARYYWPFHIYKRTFHSGRVVEKGQHWKYSVENWEFFGVTLCCTNQFNFHNNSNQCIWSSTSLDLMLLWTKVGMLEFWFTKTKCTCLKKGNYKSDWNAFRDYSSLHKIMRFNTINLIWQMLQHDSDITLTMAQNSSWSISSFLP